MVNECHRSCCAYQSKLTKSCSVEVCPYKSAAQPPYYAWLVEKEEDGNISYLGRTNKLEFVCDANMALHFSRECDASSMALNYENSEAVEHGF